jgi:predicted nuclease of restriction endonuclease-like (RecB) superfamily
MNFDKTNHQELVTAIKEIVSQSKLVISRAINSQMLVAYWNIGRLIIEKENSSQIDEKSSRQLIIELSKELTFLVGRGFSRSNLTYMRLFYQNDPNSSGVTLSHHLSWGHYYELLKIDDKLERTFYQNQIQKEQWSIREFRRTKASALFQRLAVSKNKEGILALSKNGQITEKESDLIKDPYVLEFLNIPEKENYSEKELEQKIIDNLQQFLLELGKGFAFIGRQQRITLNNKHYYVDLVFYHRVLKCFALNDLKINEVEHFDIGQMNLYLNYFEIEQNVEGDNPPIGIILTAEKDDIFVEYAIRGITNKIFVSKYQLYLPKKEELQKRIKNIVEKE